MVRQWMKKMETHNLRVFETIWRGPSYRGVTVNTRHDTGPATSRPLMYVPMTKLQTAPADAQLQECISNAEAKLSV